MRRLLLILCAASFFVPFSSFASVTEQLSYTYYSVNVGQQGNLLEAVNQASPVQTNGRVFHGYTKWYINWRYTWTSAPDGTCRIADSRVSVSATITLPRLASTASSSVSSRFDTYLANLKTHEHGHYDIARSAAQAIDKRLLATPPARTCTELERALNATGQELLDLYRDKERQYDIQTRHGATQGAALQ